MQIHVDPSTRLIAVYQSGELCSEIVLGQASTIADLEGEVRDARCLTALKRILAKSIIALDDPKFAEGLLAGLKQETMQHPMPGVPDVAPNNNPRFYDGWQSGIALRGIAFDRGQHP